MRSIFSLFVILIGCVPYQQQLIDSKNQINDFHRSIVKSQNPQKIIFNNLAYENQVNFESTNNATEITLQRLLPRDNHEGKFAINLVDNCLLIPVSAYREVHDQSEFFLIFEDKYTIDESTDFHANLIFVESKPENIIWRNTREMMYPETRFYTFDLTQLQLSDRNSLLIHLFGLSESIEYTYR